jgi:hypothetical protein
VNLARRSGNASRIVFQRRRIAAIKTFEDRCVATLSRHVVVQFQKAFLKDQRLSVRTTDVAHTPVRHYSE